jgi:hypothetical protein
MIIQKSWGLEEEELQYFKDNSDISVNESEYLRGLVYADIRKRGQLKYLPSTPAKETDFLNLVQVYPCPNKATPIFLESGGFQTNKLIPDFAFLVIGFEESFKKGFIEHATNCWESSIPFAFLDCVSDYKNGKFVSFEDYSNLENFRWIDGILRFKFKNSYEFKDSPEAIVRKKAEFEEGERMRQAERNRQYNEELRVRQLAGQLLKEKSEKEAREIIQKEKEELIKLTQSSELNPNPPASPREVLTHEN